MPPPAAFTRTLERFEARLMIRSMCAQCGDSMLVSRHDGSLQEWEDGHRCHFSGQKKKGPASAPGPRELHLRKVGERKRGVDSRDTP